MERLDELKVQFIRALLDHLVHVSRLRESSYQEDILSKLAPTRVDPAYEKFSSVNRRVNHCATSKKPTFIATSTFRAWFHCSRMSWFVEPTGIWNIDFMSSLLCLVGIDWKDGDELTA